MTTERDIHNQIRYAEKKGRVKGREEGREEGRAEERLENARSLRAHGVPVKIIATSLGLSEEQVEAL